MKIGTKSVLFGAHQFILHPIVIAISWTMLYGLPRDPRLFVAFLVHDWGYVGKGDMDGVEGESHPIRGAAIMRLLFGKAWGDFTLYHSRFYARRRNHPYSRLAVADKLAATILPAWIYVPMVLATGEVQEYMNYTSKKEGAACLMDDDAIQNAWVWYSELRAYLRQWAEDHKAIPSAFPNEVTSIRIVCSQNNGF